MKATTVPAVVATMILAATILTGAASGQLPQTRLDGLVPLGAQAGQSAEVTIGGQDLDGVDQLLFTHPGITAKQKLAAPGPFDAAPLPVENQFVVSVAGNVPWGVYEVRAQGKFGVSNPRAFEIGGLPETVEAEPNNRRDEATEVAAPCVVNGQSGVAGDVDMFRFQAAAGQRILVDCRARRLDSVMDPILVLTNAAGRVVMTNREGQAGDPLLDYVVPAAGEYFVEIRDSLYGGSPGHTYRLAIGPLPHVDFIFPPAGPAGSNQTYTVYGRNLPGAANTPLTVNNRPLQSKQVQIAIPAAAAQQIQFSERLDPHQAGLDGVEYRWAAPPLRSNPYWVTVASSPVVIEQAGDNNVPDKAQALTLPCEVAGQFYPQRDVDWYQFTAKQGERIAIDLISNRLGLPTDPMMLIEQVIVKEPPAAEAAGAEAEAAPTVEIKQIAQIDDVDNRDGDREFDTRSTDPRHVFEAPADGTYRLLVQDTYSSLHKDPRLVYRLTVRRAQPDFRLAASPAQADGGIVLRRGGRAAIRVVAFRQDGFEGAIRVAAAGLPAGVTCEEIVIGPGSSVATLTLAAADGAAPAVAKLQFVGTADVDGKPASRSARVCSPLQAGAMLQPNQQPQAASLPARITEQLVVAISEEVEPVAIVAGANKLWETSRGGKLKIPYQLTRRNDYKGPMIAMVTDLPPGATVPQVNIAATSAGEFELTLSAAVTPGDYTLQLAAFGQQLSYKHNPEAASAANLRKTELEKIAAEAAEAAKQATAAAAAGKTASDTAAAKLKAATDVQAAAAAKLAAAQQAQQQTAAAVVAAQKAAAADAANAALKTAADNAVKADTAAQAVVKTDQAALVAADKTLAETKLAAEKAAAEFEKLQEVSVAAAERSRLAEAAKQAATQKATQLTAASNPKNINFWTYSSPIQLRIAESPITITGAPAKVSIQQGVAEGLEFPVKVTRLYGFNANVALTLVAPGVGGLQAANVNVAANVADAKFKVAAAANASVGEHPATLRATLNFNGQNLVVDTPLQLTVLPAPPAAK